MTSAARVTCRGCGANNFTTVSVCWQCGQALGGSPSSAGADPAAVARPAALAPQPGAFGNSERAAATANRAAIALALLVPPVGIVVGLAFMMCEDPARQRVGRTCVLWSVALTLLSVVVMVLSALSLRDVVGGALDGLRAGARPPAGF